MIVIIASDVTYNLEPFVKKLAVNLSAIYKSIDYDFLLKNTGFFSESKTGKIVYMGHVIASKLEVPAIKIYLKQSYDTILRNLSNEKKINLEDAKIQYDNIKKLEKEKSKNYFGVDLENLDVYDLIMKIDYLDQKSILQIIEKFIAKQTNEG